MEKEKMAQKGSKPKLLWVVGNRYNENISASEVPLLYDNKAYEYYFDFGNEEKEMSYAEARDYIINDLAPGNKEFTSEVLENFHKIKNAFGLIEWIKEFICEEARLYAYKILKNPSEGRAFDPAVHNCERIEAIDVPHDYDYEKYAFYVDLSNMEDAEFDEDEVLSYNDARDYVSDFIIPENDDLSDEDVDDFNAVRNMFGLIEWIKRCMCVDVEISAVKYIQKPIKDKVFNSMDEATEFMISNADSLSPDVEVFYIVEN